MTKNIVLLLFVAVGLVVLPASYADTLYITAGNAVQSVDTATNTITTIVNNLNTPDSLIFVGPNTLLVSELLTGKIAQVDTANNTSTYVATSGSGYLQDLALTPDHKSVLMADTAGNRILKMDLATHVVTTFTTTSENVRGLTFDNTGNLFAVLNGTNNYIVKLDPNTGAVLASLATPAYGDGLTFDPVSGELWSAGGSNSLFAIKTDLSGLQQFIGPCFRWDGVEADGKGNIDIAGAGCNNVYQFNVASSTFTKLADTAGIDDLAPLVGLGGPAAVPEPSTILLVASGLATIPLKRLRRLARR